MAPRPKLTIGNASFRDRMRSSPHNSLSSIDFDHKESTEKKNPTSVWERRTDEDHALFDEYKGWFNQADVNNDGTLTVDEVFEIFEQTFLEDSSFGRPKVRSIIDLVDAFSADNSGELNLTEFATMMHYIRDCNSGEGQKHTDQITAAITAYKKSEEATHDRLKKQLHPINAIITMQSVEYKAEIKPNVLDTPFNSMYGPNQMRCLALVSHNGMKDTMMKFVLSNKNVLKKFRLIGTNSTMTMLRSVFKGDESVVFGPGCMSGPLGGDAELVSEICKEKLGGVLFFEDPLDSHPHSGDIECLNRSIKIYNIMSACNPTSAMMMMHTLRYGLETGSPEVMPSFFLTLESPSVAKYKLEQKKVIADRVTSIAKVWKKKEEKKVVEA